MKTYTYLTKYHTPTFSPLFASLFLVSNSKILENIINFYYTSEEVRKEMDRIGDGEAAIFNLIHNLQTNNRDLLIVDPLTGLIHHQVSLTAENLEKTLDFFIPGEIQWYTPEEEGL